VEDPNMKQQNKQRHIDNRIL